MALKWIYAGVVIAAALVLGLALRGGGPPEPASPRAVAAPEPRVVGGGRVDLALPEPPTAPVAPEAAAPSAPVEAALADAGSDAEPVADLRATPERIAPPVEPIARRGESRMTGTGGGMSSGRGGAQVAEAEPPPALRIRFRSGDLPETAQPDAQPVTQPVAQAPEPVAIAPDLPALPSAPEVDLANTPSDQRPGVKNKVDGQFESDQKAALGWVGVPTEPK